MRVYETGHGLFVRLPKNLWAKALSTNCCCPHCRNEKPGEWDAIGIVLLSQGHFPPKGEIYRVHYPELEEQGWPSRTASKEELILFHLWELDQPSYEGWAHKWAHEFYPSDCPF